MPLTVTEKEHWKQRIARRIERKVEAITAGEPALLEQIGRQARQRAVESLGIADLEAERQSIEREQQALERRGLEVLRAMLARVRGEPVEQIEAQAYQGEREVQTAVARRQKVHEQELLAGSDSGRAILRLQAEKEELTDVVWLATSPREIRALWAKVAELLDEQPTRLEADALAIERAGQD